jgi:hypothetical protein
MLLESDPVLHTVNPRLGAFDAVLEDKPRDNDVIDQISATAVNSSVTNPAPEAIQPPTSKPQDIWRQALSTVKSVPVEIQASVAPALRRSARIAPSRAQTGSQQQEATSEHSHVLEADELQDITCHPIESEEKSLVCVTEATLDSITPRSARHAIQSPLSRMWLIAMNKEKACHLKNKTFGTSVSPPPGAKIIPADWVFRVKYRGGPVEVNELTEVNFKARVVMRGQYMQAGLQFNDTFAPVAKPASLRALLCIATSISVYYDLEMSKQHF